MHSVSKGNGPERNASPWREGPVQTILEFQVGTWKTRQRSRCSSGGCKRFARGWNPLSLLRVEGFGFGFVFLIAGQTEIPNVYREAPWNISSPQRLQQKERQHENLGSALKLSCHQGHITGWKRMEASRLSIISNSGGPSHIVKQTGFGHVLLQSWQVFTETLAHHAKACNQGIEMVTEYMTYVIKCSAIKQNKLCRVMCYLFVTIN